jgi:RNA polymerase sigma factor (sigma-70 family)
MNSQDCGFLNLPFDIGSFQKGDQSAFRIIYNPRTINSLYNYVFNVIGLQSVSEDIIAESFSRLYENRGKMLSLEHIRRWLYVVAYNLAIDTLREKKKHRKINADLTWHAAEADDPSKIEESAALLKLVQQGIEKLPLQRRTVLRLYFFGQKSTAEIAGIMGINSQTVLNHKAKALEYLRKPQVVQGTDSRSKGRKAPSKINKANSKAKADGLQYVKIFSKPALDIKALLPQDSGNKVRSTRKRACQASRPSEATTKRDRRKALETKAVKPKRSNSLRENVLQFRTGKGVLTKAPSNMVQGRIYKLSLEDKPKPVVRQNSSHRAIKEKETVIESFILNRVNILYKLPIDSQSGWLFRMRHWAKFANKGGDTRAGPIASSRLLLCRSPDG